MAIPHLSAKIFSRGTGASVVAASAYRARIEMTDERTGETHDYTRHRSPCLFSGIYAPKDAPEWAADRARLWNHVEAFEKHRRATLAREVEIALPHELTPEQQRWLLQDWVKENVTRRGLICDVAIHAPHPGHDARNFHAHVLIVMRPLDGTEFVRSKERFDSYAAKQASWNAQLAVERASWEKLANRHLERHGHEARIDMGRLEDREPTVHLGKAAAALERDGVATGLGDLNRAAIAANENRRQEREAAAAAPPLLPELTPQLTVERIAAAALAEERRRQAHELRSGFNGEIEEALFRLGRTDHNAARLFVTPQREASASREARQKGGWEPSPPSSPTSSPLPEAVDERAAWAERLRALSTPAVPRQESQPEQKEATAARAAWAERLRGMAAAPRGETQGQEQGQAGRGVGDTSPEAAQRPSQEAEHRSPTLDETPGAKDPASRPDPAASRAGWAALVRDAAEPAAPSPPLSSPKPESEPDKRSMFRAAIDAARDLLHAIGQRLDAAFGRIRASFLQLPAPEPRPQLQHRPETAQAPREAAPAARRPLETGQEPARSNPRSHSPVADEMLEASRRAAERQAAERTPERQRRGPVPDFEQERERDGRRYHHAPTPTPIPSHRRPAPSGSGHQARPPRPRGGGRAAPSHRPEPGSGGRRSGVGIDARPDGWDDWPPQQRLAWVLAQGQISSWKRNFGL